MSISISCFRVRCALVPFTTILSQAQLGADSAPSALGRLSGLVVADVAKFVVVYLSLSNFVSEEISVIDIPGL